MNYEKNELHEEKFHDNWAKSIDLNSILVKESFESCTALENQYALKQIGDLKGKNILDLGCGAGEASIYFAINGANVTASDISEEMLVVVSRLAEKFKAPVKTIKATSEKINIPNESFDVIYGNSVLHHVDIKQTIKEAKRLLKKDGIAIFIEPISYNPAINIYRNMAKDVRTPDEHPLHLSDFRNIRNIFADIKHKEFWFSGLLIFVWFFLNGVDPNKERYWKKIIYDNKKYEKAMKIFKFIDSILLTVFPPLKLLCWNTVLVLRK